MKAVGPLMVVAALFAAGCEYQAPLTDEHRIYVDPAVLGLWQALPEAGESPGTNAETMLVLKYSDTEYLVHYPTGKDGMYFRAYPMTPGGIPCVQVQLIGTAAGDIKKEDRKYHVVSYTFANGDLVVKTLNTNLVSTGLTDMFKMRDAFEKKKDSKELFVNPARFRKLTKGD